MRKNLTSILAIALVMVTVALALILPGSNVRALPEYSSQTGEPCATCHVSPSGGGVRTPRGQAWVAESKPGAVPDLIAALDALGVTLTVNEDDYTIVPELIMPPQNLQGSPMPLELTASAALQIQRWVATYDGN